MLTTWQVKKIKKVLVHCNKGVYLSQITTTKNNFIMKTFENKLTVFFLTACAIIFLLTYNPF